MTPRSGAPPPGNDAAGPRVTHPGTGPSVENATATAEQQVAGLDVTVPPGCGERWSA